MARNEEDVIARTITHLLDQGIVHVLVVDHHSDDRTAELATHADVTVVRYKPTGYAQADIITKLARHAATHDAEWIIPFDADELWYSDDGSPLAQRLLDCPHDVVRGSWWDYYPTLDDPAADDALDRLVWRDVKPRGFYKVAFRADPKARVDYGNHKVDRRGSSVNGVVVVAHYPYRTREQFVRKVMTGAAASRAAFLPRSMMQHWRQLADLGPDRLTTAWDEFVETHRFPADFPIVWTPPDELVHDPYVASLRRTLP